MKRIVLGALLAAAMPGMVLAQSTSVQPTSAASTSKASALADRIALRLLPPGTYKTMMKSVMDQVMSSMMNQMMDLPVRDFAKMAGVGADKLKAIGPTTLNEMASIVDPSFQQRTQITMRVMTTEMTTLMVSMEPEYRAGLSEALAAHFSVTQLDELDRFFASPTGTAYASQSMLLYSDPAMMRRMQAMMPRIMQAMPAIMEKANAATAKLPKRRSYSDLTESERKKLEGMFMGEKVAK